MVRGRIRSLAVVGGLAAGAVSLAGCGAAAAGKQAAGGAATGTGLVPTTAASSPTASSPTASSPTASSPTAGTSASGTPASAAAPTSTAPTTTAAGSSATAAGGSDPQAAPATENPASGSSSGPSRGPGSGPPVLIVHSFGGSVAYDGRQPTSIGFSSDSSNILTHLTWTSWGPTSAVGHGTLGVDSCLPNCAQGTVTQVPATVRLGGVSAGHFTTMAEKAGSLSRSFVYPSDWATSAS